MNTCWLAQPFMWLFALPTLFLNRWYLTLSWKLKIKRWHQGPCKDMWMILMHMVSTNTTFEKVLSQKFYPNASRTTISETLSGMRSAIKGSNQMKWKKLHQNRINSFVIQDVINRINLCRICRITQNPLSVASNRDKLGETIPAQSNQQLPASFRHSPELCPK